MIDNRGSREHGPEAEVASRWQRGAAEETEEVTFRLRLVCVSSGWPEICGGLEAESGWVWVVGGLEAESGWTWVVGWMLSLFM